MRSDNDHDSASSITSFRSLNIPVTISHCFLLESNGRLADSKSQNKSVGCIPHLPTVDMQVVETYDELTTYDNLSLEFPSQHSKISLGKSYNKLRNS